MKKILFLAIFFNIAIPNPSNQIVIENIRAQQPNTSVIKLRRTMTRFGHNNETQKEMLSCMERVDKFVQNHKIISAIAMSTAGSLVITTLAYIFTNGL